MRQHLSRQEADLYCFILCLRAQLSPCQPQPRPRSKSVGYPVDSRRLPMPDAKKRLFCAFAKTTGIMFVGAKRVTKEEREKSGLCQGAYQRRVGETRPGTESGIYYTTELSALFGSKGMSLIQKHSLLDSFWGFH